jgi:hypothetical protein
MPSPRPAILLSLLAITASPLAAADYTWFGGSGNWNDPARWVGGNIPASSPADHIIFPSGTFTATLTPDHDPQVLNGITFIPTGTITLNTTNTNGLQFDGPNPFIIRNAFTSSTNNVVFATPVRLNQTLTISMPLTGNFNSPSLPSLPSMAFNAPISGPGGLNILSGTVQLNAQNSFAGPITIHGVTVPGVIRTIADPDFDGTLVSANTAGALGSAAVTLTDGALHLKATNAANNTILGTTPNSLVWYAANGAASGHLITAGKLILGSDVTSLSNGTASDTFATLPDGRLTGNTATLALLDRNTNLNAGAGTIVENLDGGLPTVQNLGTNADLLLGITKTYSPTIAVGASTPWLGISLSGGSVTGNITAFSDFIFQSHRSVSSFGPATILAGPSGPPVTVTFRNIDLNRSLANFSGAAKFVADQGTLALTVPNALGGGASSAPVPLEILAPAALRIASAGAVNAPLTLRTGSTLILETALTNLAPVTRDNQPLAIDIRNADALTGTQLTAAFIQLGDTISLNAFNIRNLNTVNPAANFLLPAAAQQAAGFNLNGGTILFQAPLATVTAGPTDIGDSAIRIGSSGATIAAPGNFSPNNNIVPGAVSVIHVPVIAQGTLEIGILSSPPADTTGGIGFTNPGNQFTTINVNNVALYANLPAALNGATINLKGGRLALIPTAASTSTVVPYNNTVNISADAVIADNTNSIHMPQFPTPARGRILLSTVNLDAPNLTMHGNTNLTFNSLILSQDATLRPIGTFSINGPNTINNLAQDSPTPRALNVIGSNASPARLAIQNSLTLTGPIDVSDTYFIFNGTSTPSTAPVTLSGKGGLEGTGILHRPVIFSPNSANYLFAGSLTLDSLTLAPSTTLQFSLKSPGTIGGPTNNLVQVLGNLTLDGTLQSSTTIPLGHFTLFTYTGTLTDNGLILPATENNIVYTLDTSTPNHVNLHKGFLGDANDDGTVNFSDFIILSQNFGQSGNWNAANFNNDALVDFTDFVMLSQTFGQSTTTSNLTVTPEEIAHFQSAAQSFFASQGIPEPTSLALLLPAALLILRRKTA